MKKLLGAAAALALIGAASSAFAGTGNPASDTATATATVISALTVTKTADLQFGKVVAPASGIGHVLIAPTQAGTRTASNGLTLVSSTTGSAAFTITADATSAFTVTVTQSPTLVHATGSNPDLTWTVATPATLPTSGASNTVYLGGDVQVPSTTPADTYTGSATVSATYN